MRKLTKIIATIGPASDSEEMIEKLIFAGVNIFRFNFKHGEIEWHDDRIQRVQRVAAKVGLPVGTLLDLQGPELRIRLKGDSLELTEGEEILLHPSIMESDEKGLTITHPDVIDKIAEGQFVSINDGKFPFKTVKRDGRTYLKSALTGTLGNRKTMNIPGADFPLPVLIERDFDGLALAVKRNVDYVALSFVRTRTDMEKIREEMTKLNVSSKLVSKIETRLAIDNLEAIVELSDAVMVARGDLGVELPIEEVPYYTRKIISECLKTGTPVITATQMIESMMENPYPTRAEVSDIANATYSLSDAVMLSGETAQGEHPLGAVEMMAKTVFFTEQRIEGDTRLLVPFGLKDQTDMLCDAAYNLSLKMHNLGNKVDAFVVFTHTGQTAKRLSMFKPRLPILALCPNPRVVDQLTLNFGVHPRVYTQQGDPNAPVSYEHIQSGLQLLLKENIVEAGKQYIVLFGDYWAVKGGTSTLKIVSL